MCGGRKTPLEYSRPLPERGVNLELCGRPVSTTLCASSQGKLQTSVLGHHCKVGEKAKINNCIVMDGVTIGDK